MDDQKNDYSMKTHKNSKYGIFHIKRLINGF